MKPMKILMLTNTYSPHVGGVARSVAAFAEEYRRLGHEVKVIAPEFEDMPDDEEHVIRVPAIQRFNGSDFSVPMPVPGLLAYALEGFEPDIVHAHHPFLLGDTALRLAASYDIPVVFTHHTRYEQYTHYVPGDSPTMQQFVVDLAVGYCNLCDAVIAPSETIAQLLKEDGVTVPVEVVPTGVDTERFAQGDGQRLRQQRGIPTEGFVVGHLGRLAPEKNLGFLAKAVARFMAATPNTYFLVGGSGPSTADIQQAFDEAGVADRLHLLGTVQGMDLLDAYHAMNVFAFASQSETQGMVLTEAMAAGVPVVAVDASGAREVVDDQRNGRLLPREDQQLFVDALRWIYELPEPQRHEMQRHVDATAHQFSMPVCAQKALELYEATIHWDRVQHDVDESLWTRSFRRLEREWSIWSNLADAVGDAIGNLAAPDDNQDSKAAT